MHAADSPPPVRIARLLFTLFSIRSAELCGGTFSSIKAHGEITINARGGSGSGRERHGGARNREEWNSHSNGTDTVHYFRLWIVITFTHEHFSSITGWSGSGKEPQRKLRNSNLIYPTQCSIIDFCSFRIYLRSVLLSALSPLLNLLSPIELIQRELGSRTHARSAPIEIRRNIRLWGEVYYIVVRS